MGAEVDSHSRSTRTDVAPDGSDVFHLPGVPAMRRPPCFETYTPYSLTTAMAHQARWLASPYAVLHYSLNVLNSMQHGEFDDKPFNTTPHYWLDLEAEMWTDEETFVVLGGDDFRDMAVSRNPGVNRAGAQRRGARPGGKFRAGRNSADNGAAQVLAFTRKR